MAKSREYDLAPTESTTAMAYRARVHAKISSAPTARQSVLPRRVGVPTRALSMVPRLAAQSQSVVTVRAPRFAVSAPVARSSVAPRVSAASTSIASNVVARRSYADASGNFLKEAEVEQRVVHVVQNFGKVDSAKVNRNAHFVNDLGLDSLDEVELLMAIEDEFAIEMPDSEVEKIHTVDDAVKYIASHPTAK